MEPSLARNMAAALAGKKFEGKFKQFGTPSLLKRIITEFVGQKSNLETVANVYCELLDHMIIVSTPNSHMGWKALWKETSMLGYDVRKSQETDYGNFEYATVIWLLAYLDNRVCGKLAELALLFEAITLSPCHLSENSLDRMGDTIEILMAALRAERIGEVLPTVQLALAERQTPKFFAALCQTMQLIHELDGRFHTKVVKYAKRSVGGRMHLQQGCPTAIVEFGEKWGLAYEQTYVQWRGYCLFELITG